MPDSLIVDSSKRDCLLHMALLAEVAERSGGILGHNGQSFYDRAIPIWQSSVVRP